eukprot:XP_016860928.1 serine protease 40-like [Homo sapiens]
MHFRAHRFPFWLAVPLAMELPCHETCTCSSLVDHLRNSATWLYQFAFPPAVRGTEAQRGSVSPKRDSRGPLVCPLNGTWFLMGLSSWSLDCCSPVGPRVFTRLPYFTNWISQKKRESTPPDPALAPPQETPPALDSMTSQGIVHKPGLCAALLAAHMFLLLLILLGSL